VNPEEAKALARRTGSGYGAAVETASSARQGLDEVRTDKGEGNFTGLQAAWAVLEQWRQPRYPARKSRSTCSSPVSRSRCSITACDLADFSLFLSADWPWLGRRSEKHERRSVIFQKTLRTGLTRDLGAVECGLR